MRYSKNDFRGVIYMTTIRDFMDDLIFLSGLIATEVLLNLIEWYQRQTVELLVCYAAVLFVATVFISMWITK